MAARARILIATWQQQEGEDNQNVTEVGEMKNQLAALTASINSLLKEKCCKSNFQEKHIAGMEFPRFTGKNPPIEDRIPIAVFHMRGEALSWFHEVEGLGLYNTWGKLFKALQFRFQEDEKPAQKQKEVTAELELVLVIDQSAESVEDLNHGP
jgi:hypothetical protein